MKESQQLIEPPLRSARRGEIKAQNYHAVCELIAREGPQSQVGIAERLGLSQASVSRVTGVLVGGGLLEEVARIRSRTGRRQILMGIRADAGCVAAVQVQAGSLRLRLLDLKGGELASVSWQGEISALDELLDRIDALLGEAKVAGTGRPIAVAMGVPGAWDSVRRRVHVTPNASYLEEVDLERVAADRLRTVVLVDNDVNFATLGEHASGNARDVADFFYLNIGAGVGGGAVVDGALHRGADGFAGEVGSLPIMRQGEYVMFERLVARDALAARLAGNGFAPDAVAFLERLEAGDESTQAFAAELGETIALGLAAVVTVLSPSLIVIGGSIGRSMAALIPIVERRLSQLVRQCPSIVCTSLGADASLIGAAAQALQRARALLVTEVVP